MAMADPGVGGEQTPIEDTGPSTAAPQTPTSRRGNKSIVREILETLALTAILFLLARATVQPFKVDGESMYPTLHNDEFILVDKVSYHFSSPQRGDIVVFQYPGDTTKDFVKRVIGLPGDTVAVKNNAVYVNGKALPESYLPASNKPDYTMPPYTVPKGILFVLGDNRNNSFDSHEWGVPSGQSNPTPLTDNLVVGRALVAYWPLSQLAFFGHPSYASAK